jgi:hypothetical protein
MWKRGAVPGTAGTAPLLARAGAVPDPARRIPLVAEFKPLQARRGL